MYKKISLRKTGISLCLLGALLVPNTTKAYEIQNNDICYDILFCNNQNSMQLYERRDKHSSKNSVTLFEQSGGREFGAQFQYFKSERVKITHDYSGKFMGESAEEFRTMLRLSLSF